MTWALKSIFIRVTCKIHLPSKFSAFTFNNIDFNVHTHVLQNVSMVLTKSKMSLSTSNDMGLDDIKAVDEVLMTVQSDTKIGPPRTSSPNKKSKWIGLRSKTKNGRKPSKTIKTNVFPCPMIESFDLGSPEGSVSNLGLVNSSPFASLAMTSVHARRVAKNAYRSERTSSIQSAQSAYSAHPPIICYEVSYCDFSVYVVYKYIMKMDQN